ncbi:MBL fold metallo-hydrolase [Chloroflexota bacterium]
MRFEFLGTGGASITPRPGCMCRMCAEARQRGVPYSRNGPGLFVHGPNLLIDTAEDVAHSLNRAAIAQVDGVLWSHWHPDHTAGLRVLEMNIRLWDLPSQHVCTPVYIPAGVGTDFDQYGINDQLDYLEQKLGVIERNIVAEGSFFELNGMAVVPVHLPVRPDNVYAFILTEGDKRVLVAPDELFGWQPPVTLGHFDLAILPVGVFEFDPFSGERVIPAEHPVLTSEVTFRQTLDMVRQLDADRVIFTHIGEHDRLSYDDLMRLQRQLLTEQPDLGNVMFAFDRLAVTP